MARNIIYEEEVDRQPVALQQNQQHQHPVVNDYDPDYQFDEGTNEDIGEGINLVKINPKEALEEERRREEIRNLM